MGKHTRRRWKEGQGSPSQHVFRASHLLFPRRLKQPSQLLRGSGGRLLLRALVLRRACFHRSGDGPRRFPLNRQIWEGMGWDGKDPKRQQCKLHTVIQCHGDIVRITDAERRAANYQLT